MFMQRILQKHNPNLSLLPSYLGHLRKPLYLLIGYAAIPTCSIAAILAVLALPEEPKSGFGYSEIAVTSINRNGVRKFIL
jgi:hypothetical protein